MIYTTHIRLSWEIPPNDKGELVEWCEFWFDSIEFPTKEQILKEVKNKSEKAFDKLNSIMYIVPLNPKKLNFAFGKDRSLLITNIPFDGCYISSIFILEVR